MSQKRVFAADDTESMLRAVRRLLEALGHTVDTAENYVDAVELLKSTKYDLIVCDNGMPLSPGSRKIDNTCGLRPAAARVCEAR
jgi:CheY-like chemotaxis protein